ncbi:MAG TPA: hypothetical protein PKY59_19685, partial [Pyrinomonadaceae bacterium]|nr:hypothetical protein [Pyrinomonadaceae bacterium]
MFDALERVSATIEIKPPLTLEKLMSVFGTTALMFPPDISSDETLTVGRKTAIEEREEWINSLGSLDLLLNNQPLEREISNRKDNSMENIASLESFAEEIAIRSRVLIMETSNRVSN